MTSSNPPEAPTPEDPEVPPREDPDMQSPEFVEFSNDENDVPLSSKVDPAAGVVYSCDGCGACCKTWRVLVSEEDAQREPRIEHESKRLPDPQGDSLWRFQLFPLPFHEGCCFLDTENRCTIYDSRPRVCRAFEAGSPRCQEARALANLPELLPGSGE